MFTKLGSQPKVYLLTMNCIKVSIHLSNFQTFLGDCPFIAGLSKAPKKIKKTIAKSTIATLWSKIANIAECVIFLPFIHIIEIIAY